MQQALKTPAARSRPARPRRASRPRRLALVGAACAAVLATTSLATGGVAQAATAESLPLSGAVWLCYPGMPDNPCNQDIYGNPERPAGSDGFADGYPSDSSDAPVPLDETVMPASGSGSGTVVPYASPSSPKVDCFYVYPTVDLLPNPAIDLTGDTPPTPRDDEMAIVLAQVARLESTCRLFVVEYRQQSLSSFVLGSVNYTTAENDVDQAWDEYWDNANFDPTTGKRRGVLLLAHSQGSAVLLNLMEHDSAPLVSGSTSIEGPNWVDGNPKIQPYLIAAYVLGGQTMVPVDSSGGSDGGGLDGGGTDPGASLQYIPACRRSSPSAPIPTGCVVAFSTWDSADPPANGQESGGAGLGYSAENQNQVLCVDPAAILRGEAPDTDEPLDAIAPTETLVHGTPVVNPNGYLWAVTLGLGAFPTQTTGYVEYPHGSAFTGGCQYSPNDVTETVDGTTETVQEGDYSYLSVTPQGSAGPALLGTFPGSSLYDGIGLHVLDWNVEQGDIDELARRQAATWLAAHGS